MKFTAKHLNLPSDIYPLVGLCLKFKYRLKAKQILKEK
ncbi:hypothetical protein UNSWCD_722 [Campylobacter concisus UNSWCD]|nr:hypothetical protein UNSWCD_722 [Campylobacter concisus UNSWCD]